MSVDVVHVLIAVLFVAIWMLALLLLRRSDEETPPSIHDWDGKL